MPLWKSVLTAAFVAAPTLAQVPTVFPVSAAGVVVTYGGNSSSVVVPPHMLFDHPRPDVKGEMDNTSGEAEPRTSKPPLRPGAKCDSTQNCGSMAPPM